MDINVNDEDNCGSTTGYQHFGVDLPILALPSDNQHL